MAWNCASNEESCLLDVVLPVKEDRPFWRFRWSEGKEFGKETLMIKNLESFG